MFLAHQSVYLLQLRYLYRNSQTAFGICYDSQGAKLKDELYFIVISP